MKCLILIALIFSLSKAANGLVINANDGSNQEIVTKNANDEVNELIKDEELKLEKAKLLATLTVLEKTYSVSFQIKPTSYSLGSYNIIHLTTDNFRDKESGNPALWFYVYSFQKMYLISAANSDDNLINETEILPVNEWSSIKVYQIKVDGRYIFSVYINGKQVVNVENLSPQSFEHVKVYLGDPWYDAQEGFVKELRIKNGAEEVNELIKDEELKLEQANLLATLTVLEKTYSVSFQIKPTSYSLGFHNIIHLTTDNFRLREDGNPALWFHINSIGKMYLLSAVNGDDNYNNKTEMLPVNKWSSIKISQIKVNGRYMFSVYINGKQVINVENLSPKSFKHVKVYLGDPWYDAQEGFVKELRIKNGAEDKPVPNVKRVTYQRPRNLKKTIVSNNKRSTH